MTKKNADHHTGEAITDAASAAEISFAKKDAAWAESAQLPDRAIAAYQRLIALQPQLQPAYVKLATLLLARDRLDEALGTAKAALAISPDDPVALAIAGEALARLGRHVEAIPLLRGTVRQRPESHLQRRLLAECLFETGQRDTAVEVFLDAEPHYSDQLSFLVEMAHACHRGNAVSAAQRAYMRILEMSPRNVGAYHDLAHLYAKCAHPGLARDVALRGIDVDPQNAALWNMLGNSQVALGLVDEGMRSYRRAVELAPNAHGPYSGLLLTMHYSSEVGVEEIAEEHRRWGRRFAPTSPQQTGFVNRPVVDRKLRIGYLSPDIRRHSVAYFLEPLLDHHDRKNFELVAYSAVESPDEVTDRLRTKFDVYRNVSAQSTERVVETIRGDAIDILIDLAAHAGNPHTLALCQRPAPVLVSYCGYPDTTGIEAVDYRITDWISDPEGADRFYTERLVRLPDGFLCYKPPEPLPNLAAASRLPGHEITFGSFGREYKVSLKTYDMWSSILRAVPESRLVMKSIAGVTAAVRERQLGEFARRGVDPGRVQLLGFIASREEHLASYRTVDLVLDTFPYHGTTTTLDALVMGVPVVTLSGYNHASRVGVSLLGQVALEECVATTPEDYVAKAVALARNPQRRSYLRSELRSRLLKSSLCDAPAFLRKYEFALRGMWAEWCRQQGAALTPVQSRQAAFDFGLLAGS